MSNDKQNTAIDIQYLPKQEFLRGAILYSSDQAIGFGGSRGGSKSFAVRSIAVELSIKYQIQCLIFRRYRDDLLKNHVYPLFIEYPSLKQYFNKSEMVLFHPKTNAPAIKFDYAESQDEIEKVAQGTEYQIIFIDEATQSTQEMIEYLFTANRDPKHRLPSGAKTVFTMNPGGIGHSYIKRVFINELYQANERERGFFFIQSSVWDNVFWSIDELYRQGYSIHEYYHVWTEEQRREFTLKHSEYAKNLKGLPESKKRAFLFGDWTVVEGVFFDEFSPDVHVVREENYLSYRELKDMRVFGGLDYGNHTVLILAAKDPNGNVIAFDELYLEKYSRQEKITLTKRFLKDRDFEKVTIEADTNMWIPDAFDLQHVNTPAMDYMNAGIKIIKVSKTSPDKQRRYRVAANDSVNNSLHYEFDEQTGEVTQQPKLLVYSRCKNLIEELLTLMVDGKDPEDFDSDMKDHAFDAFKHAFMSLVKPTEKKRDDRPKWLKDLQSKNSKQTNFYAQ